MADIVIRGMELPESCGMCDSQGLKNAVWHFGYGCKGDIDDFSNCPPSYCPLVPLPEVHGRLGDLTEIAKKLQETLDGMGDRWLSSPSLMAQRVAIVADLKKVKEAPTIIPAEGGDGNG